MIKSIGYSFVALFLVASLSGCSGCTGSKISSTSDRATNSNQDQDSDSFGLPGAKKKAKDNQSSGKTSGGQKYHGKGFRDPRESIDSQDGLCKAVYAKNTADIIYFLKRNNGQINDYCTSYTLTDKSGTHIATPIQMAISYADIFELLVEFSHVKGSDTISYRYNGNTYLHFAAFLESTKALKILASRSLYNVDSKNSDGYTALFYAIESKDALALVEILLNSGADANLQCLVHGVNLFPADFASIKNKADVADLLKKYGGKSSAAAKPNTGNGDLIEKCFSEFLPSSDELKKQHLALKNRIQKSGQCSYASFEEVLNGTSKLSEIGCTLSDPLKSDYQTFSTSLHRELRSNAFKFAADHCRNQTNADPARCNDIQTRFNACMGIAKNGKSIDSL